MGRRFTLVELMIVVAIIGILAAIAVPNFQEMHLRSKRGEIAPLVNGIKTAQQAYDGAFDDYVSLAMAPDASPNKSLRDWTYPADFADLGWAPNGQVRGSYGAELVGTNDFISRGVADMDADGNRCTFEARRTLAPTRITSVSIY